VDALHSYWKGESSHAAGLELQGLDGTRLYAVVNLIFLIVGVVGWLTVIITIVYWCVQGCDDS
jgi:hypothetical protein